MRATPMNPFPSPGAPDRAAAGLLRQLLMLAILLGLLPASQAAPSSSSRLEGWQNQVRQWGPGVQAANSTYGEDRVVPIRWIGSLRAGSTHALVVKYDFARGDRGIFIDSLASYDATEAGVDLAQGLTLGGLPGSWSIPSDPSLPTGAQRPGHLAAWNVQTLQWGAYSETEGIRSVPVRFTVAGSGGNRTVVIAWGVHLASESI